MDQSIDLRGRIKWVKYKVWRTPPLQDLSVLLFKCELSELFCLDNFPPPKVSDWFYNVSHCLIHQKQSYLPSRRLDWSALILNISIQSSLHWARLIQRKNLSQLFKPDSTVRDSPVSFPIPQTAVGTDAVCPNFEMIEDNLNLKFHIWSLLF